ncbi:MAG: tryptophan synthase subunit alpha [Acidobacteria bacterium]|nr:tryptophan synthase subunit alpha [Acidobacteriota bacterium]
MNRVNRTFAHLKKEGRCGLVAYVTCGDPGVDATVEIVLALAEAGADAVELGIPFSDPIADGPVIQAASWRALERGTTIDDVFAVARRVRAKSDVALIAFSYLNPIMRYEVDRFAANAAAAGIDSLLVTDLPPESAAGARQALKSRGLGIVFLLAPTSSDARVRLVDRSSDGFIYYVSTTGVTGARRDLDAKLVTRLEAIRGQVSKPLAVGFGISKREHYEALEDKCEAVVVGSAIVRAIADGEPSGAAERAAAVVRGILGRG